MGSNRVAGERSRVVHWRRTLYAIWLAQTLTIIGFSLRTPFLPFFLSDLGATSFEQQALWSGLINAGGPAMMALAAPVWGIIADRHGRKPMVLRSMFAGAVTISLMAVAQSPWHLLALRIAEGALTGTVIASTTLVAATMPRDRMGYGLGLMQMAIFSGSSVGPLIGGVLGEALGYRPTFVLSGSLLFIAGWIVLFLVQENFQRPAPTARDAPARGNSMRALLLGQAMLSMVLVLFGLRLASGAIQPILPLFVDHLHQGSGSASSLAGLTLGVMGLTSAVAAVVLGRVGDKIGQRGVLIVTALLSGLLYFPQAMAQSVTQLIVLQALFGIAAGGVLPTANAIVANLTPAERRGAVYGFTATATSLGGFAGPLGGAALAAAVDIRATFVVTGMLMVLLAFWVWRAVPSRLSATAPSQPARQAGGR